jgi:5-methylcytosine-specific restriction endonuclease McrA
MAEKNEKIGIGMRQVRYIASTGKCPHCGSKDVSFKLPLECYIETKSLKPNKVVLDFTNPQYWLKETTTKCAYCGYEFHLRDHNETFYKGLEESKKDKGDNPSKWYYNFDSYKTD